MTAATLVRPAELDDANGIAEVHVTSWRETYSGLVPDRLRSGRTHGQYPATYAAARMSPELT